MTYNVHTNSHTHAHIQIHTTHTYTHRLSLEIVSPANNDDVTVGDNALVFIEDDDDSSGLSIIGACTCTCVPVLSDSALVFIEDDDDSSGLSIIGIYLYVAFSWLLTSVVSKDQPHFM